MGNSIIKHVVEGKELFLVWSSIVDAPITYGGTKKQLLAFWKEEYGRTGLESLELRWDHSVKLLTEFSSLCVNRAGKGETKLTIEQIIDYYFVRKGKGEQPVGTDPHADEPDEPGCPMCGGPLSLLGTLGTRDHFRCRNCGFDSTTPDRKLHCLNPDTCNPDKGSHGCICACAPCKASRKAS